MNLLQQFIKRINDANCGFLMDTDIPELIAIDRLCQVLVRCGGCRFTCAAQDVAHLEDCIVAGGDYVRDVSFPVGALERAVAYVPEQFRMEHPIIPHTTPDQRASIVALAKENDAKRAQRWPLPSFNENDCGGVFDGNQVTSDADSGL